MSRNTSSEIRHLIVGCLFHIVKTKTSNVKSAWKTIFAVIQFNSEERSLIYPNGFWEVLKVIRRNNVRTNTLCVLRNSFVILSSFPFANNIYWFKGILHNCTLETLLLWILVRKTSKTTLRFYVLSWVSIQVDEKNNRVILLRETLNVLYIYGGSLWASFVHICFKTKYDQGYLT